MRKAVQHIEEVLAPLFGGREPDAIHMDFQMIDLDGTPDKSRLGANALLAVSQVLYRAHALTESMELYEFFAMVLEMQTVTIPFPLLNIINGGAHAQNNLLIQECLILPVGAPTFRAAYEIGTMVFHEVGALLQSLGKSTAVGFEGGYASRFANEYEALDILLEGIERVNKKHTLSCVMALDVAATQFYDPVSGLYRWHDSYKTSDEMIEVYKDLLKRYPIYSIEDGLAQDDWPGWVKLTQEIEHQAQTVGDDLFVTDVSRIALGIKEHAATSAIIKPNQVGTITEALQAITLCNENGMHTIISHRSGETPDTFIADLAIGTSAGQIKAGGCSRMERVAKYNRILAIEDDLTFSRFDA